MVFDIGSPIDVMALIVLLVVSIKIVVILIKPNAWVNFTTKVWAKPKLLMIVSLILAALSLMYLIGAGVTIVHIFATMLFIALLGAVGVAIYSKEVVSLAQKLMKDKTIIKKSWLYIAIWIALIIWGFYALFV